MVKRVERKGERGKHGQERERGGERRIDRGRGGEGGT